MTRVLVIGAGIFGLDLAVDLAAEGLEVTVYEKQKSILNGTTAQSLVRIHSGLHYPRDIDTAKQSAKSYPIFLKKYEKFIERDFPNFYAISTIDSRVSTTQFETFAKELEFPFEKLVSFDNYKFLNTEKLSSVYKVTEGILNVGLLRKHFEQTCKDVNIALKVGYRVSKLEYNYDNKKWLVISSVNEARRGGSDNQRVNSKQVEMYDIVIDATHLVGSFYQSERVSEFQITHMLNITCEPSQFGLTILDGDFLTLLPMYYGSEKYMSIYAPSISTVKRSIGRNIPEDWVRSESLSKVFSVKSVNEALLKRLRSWVPNLVDINPVSSTTGIRCIEANVGNTDRRVSEVAKSNNNFFRIASTKIDHCVITSNEIVSSILHSKN